MIRRFLKLFSLLLILTPLFANAQDFWQQTNGLYGGLIHSLAINSSGYLFAGTDGGGVFRSTDSGDSWTEINTGLTSTYIKSFAFNSSGHIFAWIYGGGVFRSTESTTGVEEIKNTVCRSFALEQNYPNPFNPETTIRYQLLKQANVKISIFDLQGREIKILFTGQKEAGYHTIKWGGTDNNGMPAASGQYFYRMAARSGEDYFVKVRKMVLVH